MLRRRRAEDTPAPNSTLVRAILTVSPIPPPPLFPRRPSSPHTHAHAQIQNVSWTPQDAKPGDNITVTGIGLLDETMTESEITLTLGGLVKVSEVAGGGGCVC